MSMLVVPVLWAIADAARPTTITHAVTSRGIITILHSGGLHGRLSRACSSAGKEQARRVRVMSRRISEKIDDWRWDGSGRLPWLPVCRERRSRAAVRAPDAR